MFYKCVANLPVSAGSYSPKFEDGYEHLWGGVLRFAGRVDIGGLDAEMAGKLQNGFLDGRINGLLDWRMDCLPAWARRV